MESAAWLLWRHQHRDGNFWLHNHLQSPFEGSKITVISIIWSFAHLCIISNVPNSLIAWLGEDSSDVTAIYDAAEYANDSGKHCVVFARPYYTDLGFRVIAIVNKTLWNRQIVNHRHLWVNIKRSRIIQNNVRKLLYYKWTNEYLIN